MVSQKYRWDFIGLSTDTKPTSETSDKVVNGSTFYCSDTSKLYVYCDGTWYVRKALGGGGGGGTSDYTDLTDKPKINNVELNGNKTSSDLGLQPAGNYVTNTDYAGANKVGVIRTNTDYGTGITSAGALISATKTYQQYQDATTPNMFISKGTLENVITGKGLDLKQLSTFDNTKTQVLKNINGSLIWVNE